MGKSDLEKALNAAQPRVNLTRLSRRSRLREGAAKMPCQPVRWSQSPGRLRKSLGRLQKEKAGLGHPQITSP